MRVLRTSSLLLAACALSIVLWAATSGVRAQGPADSYFIRNARIVTVTGPVIENGSLVISNGKITEVGKSLNAPRGARVGGSTRADSDRN